MPHVWQTHLGDAVQYDAQYHDNPRVDIASFIDDPPGLVLDVGCGGGATGKLIKEKFPGAKVIGIERNPRAAERARQVLDEVICADLYEIPVDARLGHAAIDLLLLLDVLEHLYDPWRALERVHEWVSADTRVLASVPNVRNLATLDELAAGSWRYEPNGVLDITHVRFFTKASLRELFESTGFSVVDMQPLLRPELIEPHVVGRQPGRLLTRNLSIAFRGLDDLEDLYALQYVIDACPAQGTVSTPGADGDGRLAKR
jgi:SAM-dependent methyltransferase